MIDAVQDFRMQIPLKPAGWPLFEGLGTEFDGLSNEVPRWIA